MEERQDALDERRQFLEDQQSGIGATDTPKILGLSRWGTALSVYRSKVEEAPTSSGQASLPAWMGLKLQATIAELYTAATGQRVRAANGHYRHKQHDFIVCHLDYRGLHKPRLLVEAKTRAYMRGWGPDGSDQIPGDVWAQVQHEMLVTNADECHVAVLFGHHTFRVYPIKRNEAFLGLLVPRLTEFWYDHVLAGVPPEPAGSMIDSKIIEEEHPESGPFFRNATPEQERVVQSLKLEMQKISDQEKVVLALENRIKTMIGDHLGLLGSFGSISWKKTKDSEKVGWKLVAEVYRRMVEELLEAADPGEDERYLARLALIQSTLPNVEGLYTTVTEGVRRFVPNFVEESGDA